MRSPATPSIDQLLVLLSVVEAGSFTSAAKRLGRATSAISYAIDTLEQQLGISLFDRGTTRKPKLTPQGEAVVSEARAVAESMETLRARVRGRDCSAKGDREGHVVWEKVASIAEQLLTSPRSDPRG